MKGKEENSDVKQAWPTEKNHINKNIKPRQKTHTSACFLATNLEGLLEIIPTSCSNKKKGSKEI